MSFLKLLIISVLVVNSSAFGFSLHREIPCIHKIDGVIANMRTPVRVFGMISEEDLEKAKIRCELLDGQLGDPLPAPMPPPGAV